MLSWLWSFAPDPLSCHSYPYVIEAEFGILGGHALKVSPEGTELSGGICLEAGNIQFSGEALTYQPQSQSVTTGLIQGNLDGWSFRAQAAQTIGQNIELETVELAQGNVKIASQRAHYQDGGLVAEAITGTVQNLRFSGDRGVLQDGVFQMEDAIATPCACGQQIQALGQYAGYDLSSGAINLESIQIRAYGIPLFRVAEFTVDPAAAPTWQMPLAIGYDDGLYLGISIPSGAIPGQNGGTLPLEFDGELAGFPNDLMAEASLGYQIIDNPFHITPLIKGGLSKEQQQLALGTRLDQTWQSQQGKWEFEFKPSALGLLYPDGRAFSHLALSTRAKWQGPEWGSEIGLDLDRLTGRARFPSDQDTSTGNQLFVQLRRSPWTTRAVFRLENSELVREELIVAYAPPIPPPEPEAPPHLSLAPLIGYDLRRAGISRAGAIIRYADCCLVYRLGVQAVFLPQPGDRVDGGFTLGIELR